MDRDVDQDEQDKKEVIILQRRFKTIAKEGDVIKVINAVWPARQIDRMIQPPKLDARGG